MTKLIESAFISAIDAAVDGHDDFCITLESNSNPDIWIQIAWDTINASYPFSEPPLKILANHSIHLPNNLNVGEWKSGQFVTFEHGAEPLPELVNFVDLFARKLLGVQSPDADLKIQG
ncbi:MAG: hypothetical protein RL095_2047 [Verrucomicrobiota bacterium]|jgi:hypothetical protein